MALALRFLAICSVMLFACGSASAQKPVAPEPHLALDELVKEYKRLGLPLPPANAELVRVKATNYPDQLGFRIPAGSGGYPKYLVGAEYTTWETDEPVKPDADALRDIEPLWVVDWICLAVQCRERGWNEFAALLHARAQEAIATPVPVRWKEVYLPINGLSNQAFKVRDNGWVLRATSRSGLEELRRAAALYWSGKVMAKDGIRREALRHLKELAPESEDVRDLELTLAPRKSKPGTVESLIDDLTDYRSSGKRAFEPLDANQRGEASYRKIVELGFDAVPALLDAMKDERLTRDHHYRAGFGPFGPNFTSYRTYVGQLVGEILNDLSGRELAEEAGPQRVDEKKARVWWEKAQKAGEEKWLVAHLSAEQESGGFVTPPPANTVLFRAVGVKYPARLGEFYQAVLRKPAGKRSDALAEHIAASRLPRGTKLALLEEGATHEQLVHRVAALGALAELDPEAFRKHLLASLKRVPPDAEDHFPWTPEVDLAGLVHRTNDPACWEALADTARRVSLRIRSQIIGQMGYAITPVQDKKARREQIQFLMKFLDDETHKKAVDIKTDEGSYYSSGTPAVRDTTAHTLAGVLGLKTEFDPNRGPVSRLFIRAAVTKAAMEELARLKK
jgi:hypothetical protein